MKKYSTIILSFWCLFLFILGYLLGENSSTADIEREVIVDTITVTEPEIVVKDSLIVKTRYLPIKGDTVYSECIRTEVVNDTTYLILDREQKQYSVDSIFDVWVSGVDVACDSLKVYQKTITNFIREPKSHVNGFVSVDYDFYNKNIEPRLGVVYNHDSGWFINAGYKPSYSINTGINNSVFVGVGYRFNIK